MRCPPHSVAVVICVAPAGSVARRLRGPAIYRGDGSRPDRLRNGRIGSHGAPKRRARLIRRFLPLEATSCRESGARLELMGLITLCERACVAEDGVECLALPGLARPPARSSLPHGGENKKHTVRSSISSSTVGTAPPQRPAEPGGTTHAGAGEGAQGVPSSTGGWTEEVWADSQGFERLSPHRRGAGSGFRLQPLPVIKRASRVKSACDGTRCGVSVSAGEHGARG
ncbi:unnamed protein product [Lampetra fluviatilis]